MSEEFRIVLEELIQAREQVGTLTSDLKVQNRQIEELKREKGLRLTEASDHVAKEKEKIIALGSKLWLAASQAAGALKDDNSPEMLALRQILHESANTFDGIPF
ncbi:MAG TPA: hypothetical protein VJL90_03560 [Pseudorhodoplanes sp.]|nr:hypothetical protein [Pseudorhodoplanes sp.]